MTGLLEILPEGGRDRPPRNTDLRMGVTGRYSADTTEKIQVSLSLVVIQILHFACGRITLWSIKYN